MKFVLAVSLLSISTSALALAPIAKLHMSMRANQKPSATVECMNLSGAWEGSCIDPDGKKYESSSLIIQPGCNDIFIDSEYFVLGAGKTQQEHENNTTLNTSIFLDWAKDQRQLNGEATWVYKRPDYPQMINATINLSWKLENDELKTTSVTTWEFQGKPMRNTETCTYR